MYLSGFFFHIVVGMGNIVDLIGKEVKLVPFSLFVNLIFEDSSSLFLEWRTERRQSELCLRFSAVTLACCWLLSVCSSVSVIRQIRSHGTACCRLVNSAYLSGLGCRLADYRFGGCVFKKNMIHASLLNRIVAIRAF